MDSTDRSVSCSAPYIGGAIVPSVTEGTGDGRWWECSHSCGDHGNANCVRSQSTYIDSPTYSALSVTPGSTAAAHRAGM